MTNEERDLITNFIARVGGTPAQTGGFANAVPTAQAQLPPIDRDADMLIGEQLGRYPEARYRLTQLAVVQEQALAQAQNRINQLQAELQQARQGGASAQGGSPWGNQGGAGAQRPQPQGLFGRLFGAGSQQAPQPQYQQPQYAPQPQYAQPQAGGGMFQRGGSGFLGSALTTAAGVAGGMVAGNALMNMFSGHHDSSTFGGNGGFGGGFGGDQSGGGWGGGQGGVDPYDVGGAPKDFGDNSNSGWTQSDVGQSDAGQSDGGWTDSGGGGDSGGGWTDSGGGGSDSI